MKLKSGSHVLSGAFGLSVAGIAWLEARIFPLQGLQEGLGAAFMPWLVLAMIVVLSLSSIAYGLARGVSFRTSFHWQSRHAVAGGLFLALCAFAVAFTYFGLFVPVVVFLIVGMRLLGAPWRKAVGVGVVAGVGTYALFVTGFHVLMP